MNSARNKTSAHPGPPMEPLIGRHADMCTQCWGCVRHCPARAIRFIDGVSSVIAGSLPLVALLARGFASVETTVLGEELVAVAYEQAHTRGHIHMKASLGVAAHSSERSAPELVEAADRALYRAKNSGRDRVEIAPG